MNHQAGGGTVTALLTDAACRAVASRTTRSSRFFSLDALTENRASPFAFSVRPRKSTQAPDLDSICSTTTLPRRAYCVLTARASRRPLVPGWSTTETAGRTVTLTIALLAASGPVSRNAVLMMSAGLVTATSPCEFVVPVPATCQAACREWRSRSVTVAPARLLPALDSWPSMTAAEPAAIGLLAGLTDSCTRPAAVDGAADGEADGEREVDGVRDADGDLDGDADWAGRGLAGACVEGAGLPGPGELTGPRGGLAEW